MSEQKISLRSILALAVSTLPLVSAASCPYISGNHARRGAAPFHPEAIIERRADEEVSDFGKCARKSNAAGGGTRSSSWWPCELSLAVLRQNSAQSNPFDADFDYATEFAKIDVEALKKDITEVQHTSQSFWPADFGDYGPFFIRLSWHSAGTYRQEDGRGGSGKGQQRFAPLNSWPDNASLDKARRLLWPIKQKYGSSLSWADLFVYAGNVAMENMGFPTYGFGFGRVDTWQADEGIYWGSETEFFPAEGSDKERYNSSTDIYERSDHLEAPLGAANMGLIYVDPRGPHGKPDPAASAHDIRKTFGRMGMNDKETVSLIAGGHAFGKTHGAIKGEGNIGREPNAAPIEEQDLGWKNSFETGSGEFAYTSGLEVIWTKTPTKWSNDYLQSLFGNKWTLVESPDGAPQWEALEAEANYPDAFAEDKFHRPKMLTSDLALLNDDVYKNISATFKDDFEGLTDTFAKTWFKLLHRDMGPVVRYLGPEVPKGEPFLWQDPLPSANTKTISSADVDALKSEILNTPELDVSSLVATAWSSASTFRISDKRGGANGARIALEPQRSFAANNPERLDAVLKALGNIQTNFNKADKQVSLADLIVLGGNAAIEKAAKDAGTEISVPFTPGRVDATQEQTDPESFAFLEPKADGFRNFGKGNARATTEELLVDRASLLALTPPEMTVLVGGLRVLNTNYDGSSHGILTGSPGQLTTDFFTNLLSMATSWKPVADSADEVFEGTDVATGEKIYTATRADLIFGSHPELRALAEVYAGPTAQDKFVSDFVKAWVKVMELDRYDIKGRPQNNLQ